MANGTYKKINLFGEEETHFVVSTQRKEDLFNRYEDFTDKFEAKKTTDDCYTPPDVFDLVLGYVKEKCAIDGDEIIRPFYPGGDYESIDYPINCVVIDNPPFSIITPIARFYISRNIKFFLFAPHLTLFSSDIDCTHIVVGGNVEYENGAIIKTSFLSNMFGELKIIGDAELLKKFKQLEAKNKANLPKYEYPGNIITVSQVQWIIDRGISLSIGKTSTKHCRGLEAQKPHKKAIFGSGFLISEKAAAEKAAAEKAAAEKKDTNTGIVWELSEKEKRIIKSLK